MKVPDLRQALRNQDLPTRGFKVELVSRLIKHLVGGGNVELATFDTSASKLESSESRIVEKEPATEIKDEASTVASSSQPAEVRRIDDVDAPQNKEVEEPRQTDDKDDAEEEEEEEEEAQEMYKETTKPTETDFDVTQALPSPTSPANIARCWAALSKGAGEECEETFSEQLIKSTLRLLPTFDRRSLSISFSAILTQKKPPVDLVDALRSKLRSETAFFDDYELSLVYAAAARRCRDLTLLAALGQQIEKRSSTIGKDNAVRIITALPRSLPVYLPRKLMVNQLFKYAQTLDLDADEIERVLAALGRLHSAGAFVASPKQVNALAEKWLAHSKPGYYATTLLAISQLPNFPKRNAMVELITTKLDVSRLNLPHLPNALKALITLASNKTPLPPKLFAALKKRVEKLEAPAADMETMRRALALLGAVVQPAAV